MTRLKLLFKATIVIASVILSTSTLNAKILVIAPHPDDDIITSAGVIYRAVERSEPVKVVFMTNGDYLDVYTGYDRQLRAVTGESYLGVPEDALIFLGYPDGYLSEIFYDYTEESDRYVSPNGVSETYGNRGLGRMDYHSYRFGVPASYNRYNIVLDLQDILSDYLPDDIFVTSEFDEHPDHSTTYRLVGLALSSLHNTVPNYYPVIHKTIVHWQGDVGWPNAQDPTSYFSEIPSLDETGLSWSDRESLDVPLVMQSDDYESNPKYLAVAAHALPDVPGEDLGFLGSFIHKDEIFWAGNILGSNSPPIVNAGVDQTVGMGQVVYLDGSHSRDPDGDALSFLWVQRSGPPVQLSNPTDARPYFTVPGGISQGEVLTFELVVSDYQFSSVPDAVSVYINNNSGNRPPVADAGPDQAVSESQVVTLDGSGSYDPDQDTLTYLWHQAASNPIQVTLSDPAVVRPRFTAPGGLSQNTALTFNLVVNDGHLDSVIDSVVITVIASQTTGSNIAPLATVTASSENTSTGQLAEKAVDGVIDGYPGDYSREWATAGEKAGAWLKLTWPSAYTVDRIKLYDRPNANDQILSATLSFSDGSTLQVGPLDNAGGGSEYTFPAKVITSVMMTVDQVSGSTVNVGLSEIEVYAASNPGNRPPVADAGPDQTVSESQVVTLDGSGSHDPDQDTLTYLWHQEESDPLQVTLSDPAAVKPSFTAPEGLSQNTALTFNLVVNDGQIDSAADSVVITVLTSQVACTGNFDNDNDVDDADLAVFAADFGRADCGSGSVCNGDFDNDQDVDGGDLAKFLKDFGRSDCPAQ